MPYKRVVITRFGGPEVLELIDESDLPIPRPGEARVKIEAATASYTDTIIRRGLYPDVRDKPPFTPGYDLVGVVDALGDGVSDLRVGQRVAAMTVVGAYSEYLCVRADWLTPAPESLDPAEAVCLVLTYTTAYQMLHRVAKVQPGRQILVQAAGGAVGTALLELGKLAGLEMYGTASSRKHDWVAGWGATPIDYQTVDVVSRTRELSGGGVDAAFDPLGRDSFWRSFQVLRRGGTLVAYGFHDAVRGRESMVSFVWGYVQVPLWNLLPNGRSAIFYSITAMRRKCPVWFREDLTALFGLLAEGRIQPIIAARVPLAEAPKAHRLLDEESAQGKIVLEM
jgi:NADPH:quinone reductase-like Zn-dependent oxidoreductase